MTIDHVELFVPDRHEAAGWYRRVLGLEVLSAYVSWADDPRGPLMISNDAGRTKLALFQGEPQGGRPTAGFHLVAFGATAGEFLDFLDRAEQLGLKDHRDRLVTPALVSDHGMAFSIYFSDPYGHRLELTTYEHEKVRGVLRGSAGSQDQIN